MFPCDSRTVVSYIIQTCQNNNLYYNNTKVQRLLYCCYGVFLVTHNHRLVLDYPRAWKYGPVFPNVFNYIEDNNIIKYPIQIFDEYTKKILINTINTFGKYSTKRLSNWASQKNSPWDIVVNQIDGFCLGFNNFIPDDLIFDYFKDNVVFI